MELCGHCRDREDMLNEEATRFGALQAGIVLIAPCWTCLQVTSLIEAVVSERLGGVVQDVMRPTSGDKAFS